MNRHDHKAVLHVLLRAVAYIPLVSYFWRKYVSWKMRLRGACNSSTNLLALQALSSHRAQFLDSGESFEYENWPEIVVSVVTCNSSRWVHSFFSSIERQTYPLSKIGIKVVDHGSSDHTIKLFEQLFAIKGNKFATTCIIQDGSCGIGAAHDRAILDSGSEYCLVTNPNLVFEEHAISHVIVAALQDQEKKVASWEFRQAPFENLKYYDPVTLETNWSSHVCVLIRRDAYERVGGYGCNNYMYAEDVELSYRFRAFGYVLKYIPRAVVNCFVCDAADQVKPLQYPNSYLGNLYLRLRYGNYRDRIIGHMMYGAKLFRSPLFDGAKGIVIKNWVRVFNTGTQLIKQNRAKYIYYPFYGLNYEIMRDGLLFETKIINNDRSYPVVTVITRTYHGRGFFLAQAIQSVFNQTYPNIELIVVQDGGSTQQLIISKMLFRAPKSCTIKFIVNEKLGRSAAGNSGLEAASGEFIVFLDDDDLLFSDHIETHMSILLNDNSISASYSVAMEVYTRLDPKVGYVEESFHTPDSFRQVWDYSILRHHNFIPIQSLLFRRDLFDCRGGFDLSLDQLEDWNLWLRYGYGNSFSYIPKTTSLFRVPADPKVRALRHVGIDSAYSFAKQKAEEAIKLY